MRRCSWSPSCREQTDAEFCEAHDAIMRPLFALKVPKNANKTARRPALDKLDRDRAAVLARLVADAGRLRLDGHSDALRRAVEVAAEAGWISAGRDGSYVPGTAESRPPRPYVPRATPAAIERRVDMIVRYIERCGDHTPSKPEIVRALNLTDGRAARALRAARAAGKLHARIGRPGYRLGPAPEPV